MSAELQNDIRLRGFLIILLSIIMNITRVHSSTSVHKATDILQLNYFLYGIILLFSLFPFKATWFIGICAQTLILCTTGFSVLLGIMSTFRCVSQSGCIQTLPLSTVTLVLILFILLLDLFQWWSLYMILKEPNYISNITQRLRILFSWCLPFAWLINIHLISNSNWSIFKFTTFHVVADPLIILMAEENGFVLIVMIVATVLDVFALMVSSDAFQTKAIVVQLAFTSVGIILAFLGSVKKPVEKVAEEIIAEPVSVKDVYGESTIRKRKNIHF